MEWPNMQPRWVGDTPVGYHKRRRHPIIRGKPIKRVNEGERATGRPLARRRTGMPLDWFRTLRLSPLSRQRRGVGGWRSRGRRVHERDFLPCNRSNARYTSGRTGSSSRANGEMRFSPVRNWGSFVSREIGFTGENSPFIYAGRWMEAAECFFRACRWPRTRCSPRVRRCVRCYPLCAVGVAFSSTIILVFGCYRMVSFALENVRQLGFSL